MARKPQRNRGQADDQEYETPNMGSHKPSNMQGAFEGMSKRFKLIYLSLQIQNYDIQTQHLWRGDLLLLWRNLLIKCLRDSKQSYMRIFICQIYEHSAFPALFHVGMVALLFLFPFSKSSNLVLLIKRTQLAIVHCSSMNKGDL